VGPHRCHTIPAPQKPRNRPQTLGSSPPAIPRLSHTTRHKFPHPCHPKLRCQHANAIPRTCLCSGRRPAPRLVLMSHRIERYGMTNSTDLRPSLFPVRWAAYQVHKRIIPGAVARRCGVRCNYYKQLLRFGVLVWNSTLAFRCAEVGSPV
jgi:hypothetical protein